MIVCFVEGCGWTTDSVANYSSHLRRVHEPIDVYECCLEECRRRFTVRCSFINHLKKHPRWNESVERIGYRENEVHESFSLPITQNEARENDRLGFDGSESSLIENNSFENTSVIDYDKLCSEFRNLTIGFNLKWLNKDTLPRKLVFEMQEDVKSIILRPLQKTIDTMCSTGMISSMSCTELSKIITTFISVESEYKFIQQLKSVDLYNDPVYFTISSELKPGICRNQQDMIIDNTQGVLMPLKFQLRKYFEANDVMDTIIENLKPSEDGNIRSLVDGKIWKDKIKNCNELVIPLNVFFDDFTTGDSVSPHSGSTKVCGIYCYVPCLPPYLLAKLDNILTVGFFLAQDRKRFSNEQILFKLVEMLIDLETNGIIVQHRGTERRVLVMIGFIAGDNLGLSEVLDLVESPAANFYCRACKRRKVERETDCFEIVDSLRTEEGYNEDLIVADASKTGIKKNSIWNRIPSFTVATNIYFDVMHDVSEGICFYGMSHCFSYFIKTMKFFSLDDLNCRKNLFVYGTLNNSNIPNDIKDTNLAKQKVRMTASESNTLIRFLPLIIGNLIPRGDPVWEYYCSLLKIFDIVMLNDVPFELLDELRSQVKRHHELYISLFNDQLKPKHHNLTHYSTAISKSGSLRRMWGMRCEGKHKEWKQYARANQNKINICKSLIIKASFKFSFDLPSNNFIEPYCSFNKEDITTMKLPTKYESLVIEPVCKVNIESAHFLTKFTKQGSSFKAGTIFYIQQDHVMNIYEIEAILLNESNEILLACFAYRSVQFDEHLQSFELDRSNIFYLVSNVFKYETKPIDVHVANEKIYLRKCNYLDCNTIIPNTVINKN